jgi:hypothetical protein
MKRLRGILLGLGTGCDGNRVDLRDLAFLYYSDCCCGKRGKGGGTKPGRSCGVFDGN